jgi:hypothetical protein
MADRVVVLRDGRITDTRLATDNTCEPRDIENNEDLIMALP